MKRFLELIVKIGVFLLLCRSIQGHTQTPTPIPITGNVSYITGGQIPYAGVSIQLANCPSPVSIPGYSVIAPTQYQLQADGTGLINSTIWPNDKIDCNGTTGASQYLLQYVVNGTPTSDGVCYQVTSTQGQWNLNTQQPINCQQTPPNPQDGTFNNLAVNNTLTLSSSAMSYLQTNLLPGVTASNNGLSMTGPIAASNLVVDVTAYGASTSLTDNSTAFNAAYAAVKAAGGGTVHIPKGVWNLKHDLNINNASNIRVEGEGDGTVLNFVPVCPCTFGNNEEPIMVVGTLSNRRQIAAAAAAGATSFTLASAGDGTDLTAGEWLIIEEYDIGAGPNQVISEWAQVLSVVGTTVNIVSPLKTAIPHLRPWNNTSGSYSGSSFYAVTTPSTRNTIANLAIRVPPNAGGSSYQILGIYVAQASRDTTIDNVSIESDNGSAFVSYLTADMRIINSHIYVTRDAEGLDSGASEIGATDGLSIINSFLGNIYTSTSTDAGDFSAPLTLDNGSEFFSIIGNEFVGSVNIGLSLATGTHNGYVAGNHLGYIGGTSPGNGINGSGISNVAIVNNTSNGGAGFGVDLEASSTWSVNVQSTGNYVDASLMNGFAGGQYRVVTASTTDHYNTFNSMGPIVPASSPANGVQTQYGSIAANGLDAFGSIVSSGDAFMSFNAVQTAQSTDNWMQPNSAVKSHVLLLDLTGGMCYYQANAGHASGTFAAFWGTAVWCADPAGNIKTNGHTVIPSAVVNSLGSGPDLQINDGTFTNGNLTSFDSSGDTHDSGRVASQVGTYSGSVTAHAACIKSVSPTVMGTCSTQPDTGGACTCN